MADQAALLQPQAPMKSVQTVMIVEMNPAILEWLLTTVANSQGYSAQNEYRGFGFSSNTDALHWIEQAPASQQLPDIALLDCSIPTEATHKLLRTLSTFQTNFHHDIVLLAMTTQRTPLPGEWDALPFLRKPFKPRALFDTIYSLLKKD